MLHPKEFSSTSPDDIGIAESGDVKVELELNAPSQLDLSSAEPSPNETASLDIEDIQVLQSNQYNIVMDRPRREIRPPRRFGEVDFVAYAQSITKETDVSGEPLTYSEALSHAQSDKWIVSMHEEIESLQKKKTWELVRWPKG